MSSATAAGACRSARTWRSPGHPEISVIGDASQARRARRASAAGPRDGRDPAGAPRRQGRSAAAPPARRAPFRYLDKGALAVVGRGKAICEIRGHELSGRLAFVTYLTRAHVLPHRRRARTPPEGADRLDQHARGRARRTRSSTATWTASSIVRAGARAPSLMRAATAARVMIAPMRALDPRLLRYARATRDVHRASSVALGTLGGAADRRAGVAARGRRLRSLLGTAAASRSCSAPLRALLAVVLARAVARVGRRSSLAARVLGAREVAAARRAAAARRPSSASTARASERTGELAVLADPRHRRARRLLLAVPAAAVARA